MAHQGDVAGMVEEFMYCAQNCRGTQGSAMYAGIDIADHIQHGSAEQQPGSPNRGSAVTKHTSQDCQHLTLLKIYCRKFLESGGKPIGFKVYYLSQYLSSTLPGKLW
ncbi:MAG: hypothetical protein TQ37_05080 [Candidatus Synechococcus spongiarum 15L]|uniref:Uncharacterized protein n=1 Tax=Candidatus Synechococcus spongiarum 15L TaxID=1608419 RepID=A0A0G8AVF4_9SYNE|nr:MAG: hypothetical protein TQ37_05080 [Candidatus Synechococcus spongiarum 15L]